MRCAQDMLGRLPCVIVSFTLHCIWLIEEGEEDARKTLMEFMLTQHIIIG
jgi:hypothetical protein